MANRKASTGSSRPKFRRGQRVFDKVEDVECKVLNRVYDPSDGCLYDIGDRMGTMALLRFQGDLRPLTTRERGPRRREARR
jgi:hypothetical protein